MIGKIEKPVNLLLLTIVTCGIYGIVWSFRIVKEINESAGRELIPSWVPIVGIFLKPLEAYYVDKAMQEFMPMKGKEWTSKFVTWLLLTFVVGIGMYMYLYQTQDSLNSVWEGQ